MWMRASVALLSAAAAVLSAGCSPQPAAAMAAVNDKVYAVNPDTMKVASGLLSGELTGMKVTERVEEGTGRVASPAKLSGKLVLKNTSKDQTLRLLGGKFVFVDLQGKPIALEDNRTEPALRLSQGYGSAERLDPGQDTTQSIEVEFPAEALAMKKLREVRLDLTYIPSAFKEEAMHFAVSIGGAK